ncbi:PQQ-dependent sugar dehydrogenase [Pseudooceanicola sp. LIPI14-2-Ac024]|uniref:PQQ-dependent sugar dehydrogenase n=1 Tax=Pseudooceanicola sp. LIPI14-2-Ac024 TaxID=3344875 RepID=UPI0035D108AA
MRRTTRLTAAVLAFLSAPVAQALDTQTGPVRIDRIAAGFTDPWSFGFLPGGGVLVTEKGGRLWYVAGGSARQIDGLPDSVPDGQGGLLDLLIPRDFGRTRQIYLTFSKAQGAGSGTALASGRLDTEAGRIENLRVIFEMTPGSSGGRHFGSRLAEGADGKIYMSIGERGDRPAAQDLSRHNGSIVRLNRDGTVPDDNPFIGDEGAEPAIWSYGHRNPQGMAVDATGQLWVNEHGAQGGDEVNRIRRGANYGWPVIAYGRHYSGQKIGEGTTRPGMEQPEFYWDPSIAPSGMVFHSGSGHAPWRGNAFVGSLKFDYVARLAGDPLREVERISSPETARVRDVREGPAGGLWFLSEDDGALYRMVPE